MLEERFKMKENKMKKNIKLKKKNLRKVEQTQ